MHEKFLIIPRILKTKEYHGAIGKQKINTSVSRYLSQRKFHDSNKINAQLNDSCVIPMCMKLYLTQYNREKRKGGNIENQRCIKHNSGTNLS